MRTATLDEVTTTLTGQHQRIKAMIQTIQDSDGMERQSAFREFCSFLAAHEAAEEECVHAMAKADMDGDADIVDERVAEEHEAGQAIAELERLGMDSPEFASKFEALSQAIIAHAEAEEHTELPRMAGVVDEEEFGQMVEALSRVPEVASDNGDRGTSFQEWLEAARSTFRNEGGASGGMM
jgi:hemerythrin superfamily protein